MLPIGLAGSADPVLLGPCSSFLDRSVHQGPAM